MADKDETLGLGNKPKSEWTTSVELKEGDKPIDRLKPRSVEHKEVLDYLLDRINMSEGAMSRLYPRWRIAERKYQAYISLPDYEQELKEMNDLGKPPKVVGLTIPYTFATISTIVTYLLHTYAGRKPMFQVGTHKKSAAAAARNMEVILQYNADHNKLIKHIYQFSQDGQIYGVSAFRTLWKRERKMRTVWIEEASTFDATPGTGKRVRKRESAISYEGNDISTIDPYNFLPDPRVPMAEVASNGEFVFWRSYEGRHKVKKEEAAGRVKWVNAAGQRRTDSNVFDNTNDQSERSLVGGGDSTSSTARSFIGENSVQEYYEVHQGTVEIIPAELGLGEGTVPEKWLFTILNKNQIIQAEPLALDHDEHPVSVAEPYTMGYSFGQMGMSDYLNQLQDGMSWLINSHMDNVRTALNNMFVVDPSKVEIQDLKEPGAGKIIRLKKSAYGQDVRQALTQMNIHDVTTNHVKDFQLFMSIGDTLSSITDNLRGQQDAGGRKTATEVRTAGEAAASRLAAQSRLQSAQAYTGLSSQMSSNLQQNLSDDFIYEVIGHDKAAEGITIRPEHVTGDFHFPIHDGTLPLDRVAMLDVWREILSGVGSDQELRQAYSMPKLFEYVAELGGAKNIEQFKIEAQPDAQIDKQVAAGNLITPDQASDQFGTATPGVEQNPARRI